MPFATYGQTSRLFHVLVALWGSGRELSKCSAPARSCAYPRVWTFQSTLCHFDFGGIANSLVGLVISS